MKIHFCPANAEERALGAPWRVHISTTNWHLGVAIRPQDKFARINKEAFKRDKIVIPERATWTDLRRSKFDEKYRTLLCPSCSQSTWRRHECDKYVEWLEREEGEDGSYVIQMHAKKYQGPRCECPGRHV